MLKTMLTKLEVRQERKAAMKALYNPMSANVVMEIVVKTGKGFKGDERDINH